MDLKNLSSLLGSGILWIYVFLFMTGSCIYSFINVVIYRFPRHMDIVVERSKCTKCGHTLSFPELTPVFGWILIGGKCRYCHEKISSRYPLVEFMGGSIALSCVWKWGISWQALISYLFVSVLTIIAFMDIDTMKIPNIFVVVAALIGVLSIPCFPDIRILERLLGIFSVSILLLVAALIVPKELGGGDIKLTAACGLFLGWKQNLEAFFLAVLAAGVYCLLMLALGKLTLKSKVAFGPFLCLGAAIALFIRFW